MIPHVLRFYVVSRIPPCLRQVVRWKVGRWFGLVWEGDFELEMGKRRWDRFAKKGIRDEKDCEMGDQGRD